jgi:hypothetical protein
MSERTGSHVVSVNFTPYLESLGLWAVADIDCFLTHLAVSPNLMRKYGPKYGPSDLGGQKCGLEN